MLFKDKLKKLRLDKGLSQQALADQIFISRSAVAKWENGLGLPSKESYKTLLAFFGATEDDLPLDEKEEIIVSQNKKIEKLSIALFIISIILLSIPIYLMIPNADVVFGNLDELFLPSTEPPFNGFIDLRWLPKGISETIMLLIAISLLGIGALYAILKKKRPYLGAVCCCLAIWLTLNNAFNVFGLMNDSVDSVTIRLLSWWFCYSSAILSSSLLIFVFGKRNSIIVTGIPLAVLSAFDIIWGIASIMITKNTYLDNY